MNALCAFLPLTFLAAFSSFHLAEQSFIFCCCGVSGFLAASANETVGATAVPSRKVEATAAVTKREIMFEPPSLLSRFRSSPGLAAPRGELRNRATLASFGFQCAFNARCEETSRSAHGC